MTYLFNTPDDVQQMLAACQASSVDELFAMIPEALRLRRPLDLPPAATEPELTALLATAAARNLGAATAVSFLGAGAYDHFIPAVVDAIASRSEYYTSYTPYQAEASQGNLQVFFEYQSLICRLTGMDVSNASLYDGGSAATEGVLMALAAQPGRRRVVTSETVHPEYREILATYLAEQNVEIHTVRAPQGTLSVEDFAAAIDERTACVLLQQPNFFGSLEAMEALTAAAHAAGAAVIVAVDPISLGLLPKPGDYGADVVVAEGQSLGNPLSFGGPYLGILACREKFVRKMPGRITGETVDRCGRRAFVLTLQTREQHIRREKATSNICTNQGLLALRATIYLASLGPQGLREVAELSLRKAHYAARRVAELGRCELAFDRPFFKEFVVRDRHGDVASLLAEAEHDGVLAGVPLGRWYPELADCFLVAVTEQRTRSDIDRWAALVSRQTRELAVHA